MPGLTAIDGPHKGAFCTITQTEALIGRAGTCSICLPDEDVSRTHARITCKQSSTFIEDLGSRNGTYVNNKKVRSQKLTEGDMIRIGRSVLLYYSEQGKSAPDEMTLVASLASKETAIGEDDIAEKAAFEPGDLVLLYQIADTILHEDGRDRILEKVIQYLVKRFKPAGAFVFLLNDKTNQLELVASRSETEVLPISNTIVRECFENEEGILAENPHADHRFSRAESVWFYNIISSLCVPMGNIGIINLVHTSEGPQFTEQHLKFLTIIASLVTPALEKAARVEAMERKTTQLVNIIKGQFDIVGDSPAIREVFDLIQRTAKTDSTVLILGESGTGKELVARALHFNSTRSNEPFVVVNCASLPESLVESELFGHERGSFTGAYERTPGKFELSDGGSLFLDEISELKLASQAKLLRVLEDGIVQPIGSTKAVKVNVRLIAASNRQLRALAAEGAFRKDLLYRLEVIQIALPPLRERVSDISILVERFLKLFREKSSRNITGIEPAALSLLRSYSWPGNIRELKNVIERCVVLGKHDLIGKEDLLLVGLGETSGEPPDQIKSLEIIEKEHILRALKHCNGHKGKAAALLGIDRKTLLRKLKSYNE